MSETEGKTRFRKYAASIMASATIAAVLFSWVSVFVDTPAEGIGSGIILGLAAKYLWEESGV